jgi:hypothetical protein
MPLGAATAAKGACHRHRISNDRPSLATSGRLSSQAIGCSGCGQAEAVPILDTWVLVHTANGGPIA